MAHAGIRIRPESVPLPSLQHPGGSTEPRRRWPASIRRSLAAADARRGNVELQAKTQMFTRPRPTGHDGICKRVAELKEAQSQKSELSRDQLRQFLTEVILTPAGKVDEQSRLCQSYKVTAEVREIRMPDKLAAAAQLAKLCGWSGKKTANILLTNPRAYYCGPSHVCRRTCRSDGILLEQTVCEVFDRPERRAPVSTSIHLVDLWIQTINCKCFSGRIRPSRNRGSQGL